MHYIVFDLEFNQDFSSSKVPDQNYSQCPFEIIQIGAVKLDEHFHNVEVFSRYVKPTIYTKISPFITELTGITNEHVDGEEAFPAVYTSYLQFIEAPDTVFCVWGMTDMRELFRNVHYFNLDQTPLPKKYINLQPYVSVHFGFPPSKLLRLQSSVEALGIPLVQPFHDAAHDAYYTAEIFKKLYSPLMLPQSYEPIFNKGGTVKRTRKPKIKVDYAALIRQFEKMYDRTITQEEQGIIKLAYNMGKTKQFIKGVPANKNIL